MRDERTINYYTLLELLPTATEDDIKQSWHEQIQVGIRIASIIHRHCTRKRKSGHN